MRTMRSGPGDLRELRRQRRGTRRAAREVTRAAEVAEEEEEVSEAAVTTEDTAEAAAGVEIEETEATGVREESGEVTVEVEAETEDNMMTAGTTRGRTGHAEGETLVNENLDQALILIFCQRWTWRRLQRPRGAQGRRRPEWVP